MIRSLTYSVLLAVLWMMLVGEFGLMQFVTGLAAGALVFAMARRISAFERHWIRPISLAWLILALTIDIVRSSLRVARQVMTMQRGLRPAVLAVPVEAQSDLHVTLIANMISLMPGTLTLDHTEDGRTLYVHVLHVPDEDVEAVRQQIRRRTEKRVLRALPVRDQS